MSPLKRSLFAALASATLTAGALAWIHKNRANEAHRLRQSNHAMQLEAVRRRELSQKAASLAIAAEETQPAAKSVPKPAKPLEELPRELGDYRNEGQRTPLATLQTFAWACDRGDVQMVARLIEFEPAARSKAEAFLANLPNRAALGWNSPEEAAAAVLTQSAMHQPFPAAAVLATATEERETEDRVVLRLPGSAKDRTVYRKTGDTWRRVVTEAMVDAGIADLRKSR